MLRALRPLKGGADYLDAAPQQRSALLIVSAPDRVAIDAISPSIRLDRGTDRRHDRDHVGVQCG